MKKWWLYTASCVCNAVVTTTLVIFFFYDIIRHDKEVQLADGDSTIIIIILLCYVIYITADIWGIKLYYRFKNFDEVSFTDKGKIQVLLFFLVIVQLFMGFISFMIISRIILDFPEGFDQVNDFWDITPYLVLLIFFTALAVLFGYFFLLKAINRNKKVIKAEIDNIGIN